MTKKCITCCKDFNAKRNSQRFCCKSCAQHDPKVIEKMKASQRETYSKHYGVEHPMKTKAVVDKFKQSMKNIYGVDAALKCIDFVKKSKDTKLNRYNNANYNNIEKNKQTCMSKYGVDSFTKTEMYKNKTELTCLKKYGVNHPSKTKQYKLSHKISMFEKFMKNDRFINFIPLFNVDEYDGVTKKFNKPYKFRCKRCNNISVYDISNGKPVHCMNCDKNNSSYFQKEVYDFVKECVGKDEIVLNNEKRILYPKELDIYVPSMNLAIECDGLYWHSEILGKKNKIYHINKTSQAMLKGIKLIHVFENEWIYKKEVVKSILINLMGKTKNKINGRECIVKDISLSECKTFLTENHIQGNCKSSIKLGLFFDEKLVSVMTFTKSRFDKRYKYEISRYCNKTYTSIIGGASKLFSHFVTKYNPETVVSYNDKRYFDGMVYLKLGFRFISHTPPNYYYIIDNYKSTKNRMTFQKHKLKNILPMFDENLSEWENMKNNGIDRIWDCGNDKWVFCQKLTLL